MVKGGLPNTSASTPTLCCMCTCLQTAIAEGLAHAVVSQRNPDGTPLPAFLRNKRILQLDVGLIIAGGPFWGGRLRPGTSNTRG